MKLLITGSDGFIGTHVTALAEARGHDVWTVDEATGASLDEYDVDSFREYDAIIHLAAYIDIKESFEKPWEYIDNNLNTLKLFSKARRVVFASSAAVYGVFSPYGYTKRLGEAVLPKNSVALRIFNPFGPGENHSPETHIIPLLLADELPTVYQGGKQIRDFIDVRDVAEAFVLTAESDITGVYDLCNTPLSISEVGDLLGKGYLPVDEKRDEADIDVLVGDKKPLQKALNWKPKHNVKSELKKHNW